MKIYINTKKLKSIRFKTVEVLANEWDALHIKRMKLMKIHSEEPNPQLKKDIWEVVTEYAVEMMTIGDRIKSLGGRNEW